MADDSITTAAKAALSVWTPDIATIMVAIAGAESGWNPKAGGDSPEYLVSIGAYQTASLARSYHCPPEEPTGPASWGLWQIFMPYHLDKLAALGAPMDNPCATASWLMDPYNNAKAADAVYKSQGLDAWTVYKNGSYKIHLAVAETAVKQIIASNTNNTLSNTRVSGLGMTIPFLALTGSGLYLWYRTKR